MVSREIRFKWGRGEALAPAPADGREKRRRGGWRAANVVRSEATLKSTPSLPSRQRQAMHPMYHCKACSKTYGSRATLSRHERNHRKSAKHYCEECQINFTRRDLLNRHLEIHSSARSGTQSRRRCHTACQRCKESRCKCDGGQLAT